MKQQLEAEIAALSSRYRGGDFDAVEAFTRRFGKPIHRIVRRALRTEGRTPSPLAVWVGRCAARQPCRAGDNDELAAAIAHEIGQVVLGEATRNGRSTDRETVTGPFATERVTCRAPVG